DLDTTRNVVKRITNTVSKDFAPLALDDNNFYYLSDQRGIVNLFRYDRATGIYTQVTNFASNVKDYDLNFPSSTMAFVTTRRMRESIYVNENFNLNRQIFTPATRRRELEQARVIRDRRKQEESRTMSIKDLLNQRLRESQLDNDSVISDTVQIEVQLDSAAADTTGQKGLVNTEDYQFDVAEEKEDVVSTDDYKFEDDRAPENKPSESFLTRYIKAREKSRITGPFPYEDKFSA